LLPPTSPAALETFAEVKDNSQISFAHSATGR